MGGGIKHQERNRDPDRFLLAGVSSVFYVKSVYCPYGKRIISVKIVPCERICSVHSPTENCRWSKHSSTLFFRRISLLLPQVTGF